MINYENALQRIACNYTDFEFCWHGEPLHPTTMLALEGRPIIALMNKCNVLYRFLTKEWLNYSTKRDVKNNAEKIVFECSDAEGLIFLLIIIDTFEDIIRRTAKKINLEKWL